MPYGGEIRTDDIEDMLLLLTFTNDVFFMQEEITQFFLPLNRLAGKNNTLLFTLK